MARTKRFAHEIVLVAGSQVAGQVANLVRNILLARMLGPAEMGIAAMLGLAMTLLEMISDVAAEEMLVTGERADDSGLQSTLHGLRVLRCTLIAGAFLALSPFVVSWFGIPSDPTSIGLCVAVLMVRGFSHSDVDRFIRDRRFGPYAVVQLVPQCVSLLFAYPAAKMLGDFRAVLGLMLIHGISATVVSQLVAKRGYRVGLDRRWLPDVWKFGGPILANGVLLFMVFQGDRFVVGTFYTPTEVGVFVTALSLALVPVLLLARVNATLLLPRLAARQKNASELAAGWRWTCAVLGAVSVVSTLGLALVGPVLLPVVYGSAFASGAALIGVIGVGQGLFLLRDSLNVVAMARNDTRQPLMGNVLRLMALPVCGWLAWKGFALPMVLWVLVAAEYVSLVAASARLRKYHDLRMREMVYPASAVLGLGVGANLWMGDHGWMAVLAGAVGVLCLLPSVRAMLEWMKGVAARRGRRVELGVAL